jgi:endoglycosylceramidase
MPPLFPLFLLPLLPPAVALRWKAGNDVHVERCGTPGVAADWRYVDGFGRERLFRGINVVYKDPPYLPTATSFDTNFSWVADDAKLLASMGFNLIRLGVMWPGVNPESADQVDAGYIQGIKAMISIAAEQGIYTMIDPHQDELSPRFCGEGAPNWWVLRYTETTDFPVPVRTQPYAKDPSRLCPGLHPKPCPGVAFPGRELCDRNSSFSYIWTHNGAKAYQTLWENPDTGFSQFWRAVAQELHGQPGVIGGELWNEPFPGDVFGQPEMRNNTFADLHNLSPFYRNVTAAIREAVPDQTKFAIAYEPSWPVGDQDLHPDSLLPSTSGFAQLPEEENGIYAFHWYVPPASANLTRYLEQRLQDARRLQAAPYASEWNFGAWSPASAATFFAHVAAFESRRIAYTGWQYKNFQGALPHTDVNPTCTGCGSSFFHPDGRASRHTFEGVSAPFAQSVAGRVLSIDVTPLRTPPAQRRYALTYVPTNTTGPDGNSAPSELVVSSLWLPREQLDVQVSGQEAAWVLILVLTDGAKLTDGVQYAAATKVVVGHNQSAGVGRAPVTVTIQSKA